MLPPELARGPVDAVLAAAESPASSLPAVPPSGPRDLDWHRASTERLRVLVDFLARPIHAPGGQEPDPDVLSSYNLAIEAALNGIRLAAVDLRPG